MTDDSVVFKSFSKPRPPIKFAAGPDEEVFECYPVMPPARLQELMNLIKQVRTTDTSDDSRLESSLKMLSDFFEQVLRDEYIDKFKKKLSDRVNGIQIDEGMDIFQWLIERYGLRPSTSSASSSAGSPSGVDGNSSTDGVSPEGSDPSS
jgi:hypothetical protein